jgi:hypothetical protein
MSIVRVSELDGVTGLTPQSQFLVSYGDGPTRVSKHITVDDLFVYRSAYRYYGSFSSNQTQTTTGGTQSFTYNSVDLANGITTGTTVSQIKVLHSGTYNIQFSAQVQRTSGGSPTNMFIWFSKNGNNIPNSNTDIGFGNNNTFLVAAWNIIETFNANDYFEIKWASADPAIQIVAVPSPAYGPAIPSIITTITQV